EDVGTRPLPVLARLPVLPVQEPMFEHGMPGSEAMGFLQKSPDGRLIRDGCGAETYARHSTGSSSTLCALVYVHRNSSNTRPSAVLGSSRWVMYARRGCKLGLSALMRSSGT